MKYYVYNYHEFMYITFHDMYIMRNLFTINFLMVLTNNSMKKY